MSKHFLPLALLGFILFGPGGLFAPVAAQAAAVKNLEAVPRYGVPALLPGVSVDVDVLITIMAPEVPKASKRPPAAVSLVVDRSGSMDEAKKIDYARRACKTLVRSLEKDDLFALTVYDDKVNVLFPLGPVKDREKLLQLIDRIEPGGWTFLSGGLEAGIKQLERVKSDGPARVILLSDGLANHGVTQPEKVAAIGAAARKNGISVSSIGLGLDFNENLMQHLAQRGGGQYYYIADSESLPSVFRDELNLVVNSFTKDLRAVFKPADSIRPDAVKVYGYTTTSGDGAAGIEMSDFSSGEERQVMLRLRVHGGKTPGLQELGTLNLSYVNQIDGREHTLRVPLAVEIVAEPDALDKLSKEREDEIVAVRQESLLREADEAHLAAMAALEEGKISEARAYLEKPQAELAAVAPANPAIANKLEQLRIDAANLERAGRDRELQNKMVKGGKASAYLSSQGKKSGMMLQDGDTGYLVERLQKALTDRGYYTGKIDGVFSREVEESVKAFQKANSLTVDGIAGAATMNALGLH